MNSQIEAAEPETPLRKWRMLRLLAAFIDAWADHNWAPWETVLVIEGGREEGWNEDQTRRTLRRLGARDQYGVYAAAGLTKAEAEVAFLHFDRRLDSGEIGRLLNRPAVTVRVQLHRARERLRQLAPDSEAPL